MCRIRYSSVWGCTVFLFMPIYSHFFLRFPYHFGVGRLNHTCTGKVHLDGNMLFPIFIFVAVENLSFCNQTVRYALHFVMAEMVEDIFVIFVVFYYIKAL